MRQTRKTRKKPKQTMIVNMKHSQTDKDKTEIIQELIDNTVNKTTSKYE